VHGRALAKHRAELGNQSESVCTNIGHSLVSSPLVKDVETGTSAWREAGSGEAVLFLHGLGGSRTAWDLQLDALCDRYRCIAWDAPGYGAAPPIEGAWSFARLTAAAERLLDDAGEQRAHVVGMSFGGMVAQHLAARKPDRVRSLSLLASSPAFGLDGETTVESWKAARLAPLDAGAQPRHFAETVLRAVAGPRIAAGALESQRAAMARVPADALRQAIDCLVTHDARAMLPTVTARTLVLVGELDEETPPDYARTLAELVPDGRLIVVPGVGHLLHVEAPESVNTALREHLRTTA
jgi:pimeloyl-ACP methyl ester carboxylesterase